MLASSLCMYAYIIVEYPYGHGNGEKMAEEFQNVRAGLTLSKTKNVTLENLFGI